MITTPWSPAHCSQRQLLSVCITLALALMPAAGWPQDNDVPAATAATTAATIGATTTTAKINPEDQSLKPEHVTIALTAKAGLFGSSTMQALLYKPHGDGPFPVLLFSHGRAGTPVERAKLIKPIGDGHVRFWQAKGFAVLAPIRPGYGETGGTDLENAGAAFDTFGSCIGRPDFRHVAEVTNIALFSALAWIRAQPWADSHKIVMEGQSVGGFATIAAVSKKPDGVIGYINFSGGAGGSPDKAPDKSCDPKQMAEVLAEFGTTTSMPGLWLYAENDHYWGEQAPRAWYAAYAVGGNPAEFVQTAAVPDKDGHQLLSAGGKLWRAPVDHFVKQLGF